MYFSLILNDSLLIVEKYIFITDSMYIEFLDLPCMKRIAERTVWLMIDVPGQTLGSPDLPSELVQPLLYG